MDNMFQDINGFGASPDGLGATVRVAGPDEWLGADTDPQTVPVPVTADTNTKRNNLLVAVWAISGAAGAAIGAYHGYKRNDSVGWAIGWSLLGSLFPIIVIPVAFAQGIGERK